MFSLVSNQPVSMNSNDNNTEICTLADGTSGKCVAKENCSSSISKSSDSACLYDADEICCTAPLENSKLTKKFETIRVGESLNSQNRTVFKNFKRCGLQFADRVFGGKGAVAGEFPFYALLKYEKENGSKFFHCGGSLILG